MEINQVELEEKINQLNEIISIQKEMISIKDSMIADLKKDVEYWQKRSDISFGYFGKIRTSIDEYEKAIFSLEK
ncbi:MAG: hypothetical protein RSC84_03460 [Peptostreptococcaceae bacterium]